MANDTQTSLFRTVRELFGDSSERVRRITTGIYGNKLDADVVFRMDGRSGWTRFTTPCSAMGLTNSIKPNGLAHFSRAMQHRDVKRSPPRQIEARPEILDQQKPTFATVPPKSLILETRSETMLHSVPALRPTIAAAAADMGLATISKSLRPSPLALVRCVP